MSIVLVFLLLAMPLATASAIELEVSSNTEVTIKSELKNPSDQHQGFVYIVQFENSIGATEFIAFKAGVLQANGELSVSISWSPEIDDIYDAKVFLISSFENPVLLSDLIDQSLVTINGRLIATCSGTADCFVGTVTRIVDGDTIDVGTTRIRLALTNTPEEDENGYGAAKDFTSSMCSVGSEVLVDQDDGQPYDIFGRMVAKLTCDEDVLNAELLEEGYATLLTEYCNVSEFADERWALEHGCADVQQDPEPTPLSPQVPPLENCDPSYPDVCVPPSPPDLDCGEISYRNFKVLEPDPHGFDRDDDGIGCET